MSAPNTVYLELTLPSSPTAIPNLLSSCQTYKDADTSPGLHLSHPSHLQFELDLLECKDDNGIFSGDKIQLGLEYKE